MIDACLIQFRIIRPYPSCNRTSETVVYTNSAEIIFFIFSKNEMQMITLPAPTAEIQSTLSRLRVVSVG
jgi:hypothetical protein